MTLLQEPPLISAAARPAQGHGRIALVIVRALLVLAGLGAWFFTQHLLGTRAYNGHIDDGILALLSPVHGYLLTHAGARNALLISSSAVIDLLGLFLLGRAILGPTIRPFLGLLILFGLRQLFQALCVLPMPEQMIWPSEGPGFPSLLVTYGVSNDLFFSGHTALAVFGAVELVRWGGRRFLSLGIAVALFEMLAVLALRAHWTMDVYAGAVTALLVAFMVTRLALPLDRALIRLTGSPARQR